MSTITTYQLETIINIAREDYYTFNKAFRTTTGQNYDDYSILWGDDYSFSWTLRKALNNEEADFLIACTGIEEEYNPLLDDYEWLMANC